MGRDFSAHYGHPLLQHHAGIAIHAHTSICSNMKSRLLRSPPNYLKVAFAVVVLLFIVVAIYIVIQDLVEKFH